MDHEERKPNVTLRFGQPKQSLVIKISLKDWEIIKKESTSNPPGGETFETKIKKDPSSPKRPGDEAPCPDKFQLSDSRFACGQCDYVATQNGHLKRHKVSKHSNITVECEQCQICLKPNNMTRHMKEVHRESRKNWIIDRLYGRTIPNFTEHQYDITFLCALMINSNIF